MEDEEDKKTKIEIKYQNENKFLDKIPSSYEELKVLFKRLYKIEGSKYFDFQIDTKMSLTKKNFKENIYFFIRRLNPIIYVEDSTEDVFKMLNEKTKINTVIKTTGENNKENTDKKEIENIKEEKEEKEIINNEEIYNKYNELKSEYDKLDRENKMNNYKLKDLNKIKEENQKLAKDLEEKEKLINELKNKKETNINNDINNISIKPLNTPNEENNDKDNFYKTKLDNIENKIDDTKNIITELQKEINNLKDIIKIKNEEIIQKIQKEKKSENNLDNYKQKINELKQDFLSKIKDLEQSINNNITKYKNQK